MLSKRLSLRVTLSCALCIMVSAALAMPAGASAPPPPETNPEYPEHLDNAANGEASTTNRLFTVVLDGGVTRDWTKVGENTYRYDRTGNVYIYTNADGTFTRQ